MKKYIIFMDVRYPYFKVFHADIVNEYVDVHGNKKVVINPAGTDAIVSASQVFDTEEDAKKYGKAETLNLMEMHRKSGYNKYNFKFNIS